MKLHWINKLSQEEIGKWRDKIKWETSQNSKKLWWTETPLGGETCTDPNIQHLYLDSIKSNIFLIFCNLTAHQCSILKENMCKKSSRAGSRNHRGLISCTTQGVNASELWNGYRYQRDYWAGPHMSFWVIKEDH